MRARELRTYVFLTLIAAVSACVVQDLSKGAAYTKGMIVSAVLACSLSLVIQTQSAKDYSVAQAKWRADYQSSLLQPEGWFAVAGLFWLKPGANTFGSDSSSTVVLPTYASPPIAGIFNLNGDHVTVSVVPGVELKVNGKPAGGSPLLPDTSGHPDQMSLGGVTFHVIQRADKLGIRLYDPKSSGRKGFHGLNWYPIDQKWVVPAQFVPYDPPKAATIMNVIGQATPVKIPGYLAFKINGVDCRLDAQEEDGGWFLDFQDKTSGKTTYGAGRFLDVLKPKDGPVLIDFNEATNPPCAYTSFATCPLPPAGNQLSVAVTAGEKKYHS